MISVVQVDALLLMTMIVKALVEVILIIIVKILVHLRDISVKLKQFVEIMFIVELV
jgi:hypothetical protein